MRKEHRIAIARHFYNRMAGSFYLGSGNPGVVLYLNSWFPSHKENRVMAGFMVALPLSLCIGGPVSGWVLQNMHETFGYRGWQWMLIVEDLPAIILGVMVLLTLTETIDDARWLKPEEKSLLKRNLSSPLAYRVTSLVIQTSCVCAFL